MNAKKILLNGILHENPTFRLVLGMCPTLAITYQATNGIAMGLATTFVLVFSNLVISLYVCDGCGNGDARVFPRPI